MSSKKRKTKGKISSTEVRTPINLKEIANKQKIINRQHSNGAIPFVKQREATPSTQKSFYRASQGASIKNFHLLMENPIFSEDYSQKSFKVPSKVQVDSESFSQNDGDFEDFRLEEKKFMPDSEKTDAEKLIALKYKRKYQQKMNEIVSRQNEMHKFEIESIKNQYEGKISKYREIIKKLQEDYEKVCRKKEGVKKTDVLDPLIEENRWLKSQINALRASK